jgi:hypothetical protein
MSVRFSCSTNTSGLRRGPTTQWGGSGSRPLRVFIPVSGAHRPNRCGRTLRRGTYFVSKTAVSRGEPSLGLNTVHLSLGPGALSPASALSRWWGCFDGSMSLRTIRLRLGDDPERADASQIAVSGPRGRLVVERAVTASYFAGASQCAPATTGLWDAWLPSRKTLFLGKWISPFEHPSVIRRTPAGEGQAPSIRRGDHRRLELALLFEQRPRMALQVHIKDHRPASRPVRRCI